MRIKLLVISLFISLLAVYAQATDTLKARYGDSLLSLANSVYYSNPDSSAYYAELALNHALKHNLNVQTARAWYALSKTEILKGDVEAALKHLKDAVNIFEKSGMRERIATCYGLMSVAVGKVHNDVESVNLLLKSVAIFRELNDKTGLRKTLVNLANSYTKTGEFDKALEALNESKLYTEPGDNQWFFYHINAGIIQQNKKNYALAKTHFDSCLVISHRHNMVDAEVTAVTNLAELYGEMKKTDEAITYFNQAIEMARAHHLPIEESEALEGLMNCYEITGDYKRAFVCQNRLKVISDSLFNIEKIKNINAVEAKLKVSEKEKTIALQKLDMQKNAAEQEKSRKRITLLIAGTLFLATVLFFTFYVYAKTRRQKREVELQKTRAERLNSLNQKIFAVIAHDFKSPLITLNMLIDLLDKENISKEDLSYYSADVRNQITQSGQILENLLNWAKTELNMTQGNSLSSSPSLVAGEIVAELNYMTTRKNISVLNEIPESLLLKLPPDILRIIIRNLVSNAVKFSFSNSSITIGTEGNAIFVKDNGSGINEKMMNELFNGTVQSKLGTFNETGFGLGLHITHELVTKFNGRIMAENNHPSGTVFKFVLPVYEQN